MFVASVWIESLALAAMVLGLSANLWTQPRVIMAQNVFAVLLWGIYFGALGALVGSVGAIIAAGRMAAGAWMSDLWARRVAWGSLLPLAVLAFWDNAGLFVLFVLMADVVRSYTIHLRDDPLRFRHGQMIASAFMAIYTLSVGGVVGALANLMNVFILAWTARRVARGVAA